MERRQFLSMGAGAAAAALLPLKAEAALIVIPYDHWFLVRDELPRKPTIYMLYQNLETGPNLDGETAFYAQLNPVDRLEPGKKGILVEFGFTQEGRDLLDSGTYPPRCMCTLRRI